MALTIQSQSQPQSQLTPPFTPANTTHQTKPHHLPIHITSTAHPSTEHRTQITTLFAKAFTSDPVATYLLHHVPWYNRQPALYHLFHLTCIAAEYSHATFYSSNTFSNLTSTSSILDEKPGPQCTAIVLPPGRKLGDLDVIAWADVLTCSDFSSFLWYAGAPRLVLAIEDFRNRVARAKERTFAHSETYYYISHIATAEKDRGKGLAPVLVRNVQETAQREMKPVWLEASSRATRAVCRKGGFWDVGEGIVLGRGECGEDGEKVEEGRACGFEVFPMVWWPSGYASPTKSREWTA